VIVNCCTILGWCTERLFLISGVNHGLPEFVLSSSYPFFIRVNVIYCSAKERSVSLAKEVNKDEIIKEMNRVDVEQK
jgi:hypothetical protein